MKYFGKEPCHGCGKTGAENSRFNKNRLCEDCNELLKLGKSITIDQAVSYVEFFQHFFAYEDELKIVHDFLSAVHNEYALKIRKVDSMKMTSGNNGHFYKIDERFYEPLKKLFDDLDNLVSGLNKEKEKIPGIIKKQIANERDEIFNAGITKGRNLLLQLNAGEITLSDLEERLHYRKP